MAEVITVDSKVSRFCPLIFKAFIVLGCLQLVNFFMTPNPYLAGHSGFSAMYADSSVRSYRFHIGYLGLATMVLCGLGLRRLTFDVWLMLALAGLLFSGFITGSLNEHLLTYLHYVCSLAFVSLVAYQDAVQEQFREERFGLLGIFVTVTFALGFLLVLVVSDGRYGKVPFAFSRTDRGEVTLWYYLSLHYLVPALAVTFAATKQKLRYLFWPLGIFCVVVAWSSYTRSWIVVASLPFLVYAAYKFRSPWARVGVSALVLMALASTSLLNLVIDWFLLKGSGVQSFQGALTGRYQLWGYYLEAFLSSPLFGQGSFQVVVPLTAAAHSEVGLLRWFAENGLVFAIPMCWLLLRGVVTAMRIVLGNSDTPRALDWFAAVVVLSMLPLIVLEAGTRILGSGDFVLYWAVFYLNYLGPAKRRANEELELQMAREPEVALIA